MTLFALDPFFREVERYVEKGEGWARYDVKPWQAEQKALRIAHAPRRADALLLTVAFAAKVGARAEAQRIAHRASWLIERLDDEERERRAEAAADLFLSVGAIEAAHDLVPYVVDEARRAAIIMHEFGTARRAAADRPAA